MFDAGCGTGLCGPLLRNVSAHLAGVDLSENMVSWQLETSRQLFLEALTGSTAVLDGMQVALARKREVYDVLVVGELVEAIRWAHPRPRADGQAPVRWCLAAWLRIDLRDGLTVAYPNSGHGRKVVSRTGTGQAAVALPGQEQRMNGRGAVTWWLRQMSSSTSETLRPSYPRRRMPFAPAR